MNSQREAFEKQYCENSGITVSEYRKEYVTLPCQCPEEGCPGWAVVRATPLSIKTHVDLYAPDWQAATEQGVGEVVATEVKPISQAAWLAQHGRDFVGGDPYPPVKTVIPVIDESELWAVLEAATEAMDRKALPVAYISLAWNAGAEVITKRRHKTHPHKPTGGGVPDSFDALIADARAESKKAMAKFPQPNYVITKVAEEAGEVVKEAVHCAEGRGSYENLRAEMKQTIAMLYRLWVEGDQVHGLLPVATQQPPERGDA